LLEFNLAEDIGFCQRKKKPPPAQHTGADTDDKDAKQG
jgi:hypothetical protein